jgi:hypothetical protein
MPKPPPLDALAKRYLDLWQDQLGGVTRDQEAAEIMARTVELMNAGAATFAAMAAAANRSGNAFPFPDPMPEDGPTGPSHDAAATERRGDRSGPSRAKAAAAARGGADDDVAELARRLERIEKRLAALEARAKKGRPGAAKKPRRR